MLYDELVKRLREAAEYVPCIMDREDAIKAADAIEELSKKATPKRVGFSGWKGCRDTRYKCPYCSKYARNDEKYCHKCGQALMFPIIGHTPYVLGRRQEVIITWPDELPEPTKEE